MKHLFIINSQSQKNLRDDLTSQIRDIFQNEDYTIEMTDYPRHATKIVKKYIAKYQDLRIYACGGDGTIHEVINGIYPHQGIQLALVPIGTGNDFVKSFGYDKEDFRHLERYLDPLYIWSDLVLTQDEVSINTVSLGFDVKIADNVSKFKKLPGPKGTVPYYFSLLYSMSSSLSNTFKIQFDESKIILDEFSFVVFGNGQHYGGGYRPCPQAKIDDGILDFCLIKKIPRALILRLSNEYKKGNHLRYKKYVQTGKVKKIQILNSEPVKICLDGEIRVMHQPTIELIPHQILICLPKKVSPSTR